MKKDREYPLSYLTYFVTILSTSPQREKPYCNECVSPV